MASTLSAKKRIRQNVKQRARNRWRKAQVKDAVREYKEAIQAGDRDQAGEKLKTVYKRLDKIAAKGTIHKNAAARHKSRLTRLLNTIGE